MFEVSFESFVNAVGCEGRLHKNLGDNIEGIRRKVVRCRANLLGYLGPEQG